MVRLLAAVFVFFAAACDKPTLDQCEQVCRKYGELKYRQSLTAKTVGVSAEDAKKIVSEGEAKWESMQKDKSFLLGLDNCVTDCRTRIGKKDIACADKASSVAEMDKCLL